ncbi:MAG: DNA polymerase/3'-5' exonuclease PolX [Candidatus Nanoarchaeia archaeon]|nr:DNA polymerase/3'-5' exonuclease PolX [Candidatus Nanoarchaeia archaeon]
MINQEIADILYRIADLLEIKEVEWEPRAYRRAAQAIESYSQDLEEIYKESGLKGLMEIPGVGKSIASHIEEYIKTGKIQKLKELQSQIPKGLTQMLEVMGLGPKRISILYKKLKIKNVNDLIKSAKQHKISKLEGFGLKSEENILEAVYYSRQASKRFLLSTGLQTADSIISQLSKLKEVKKIESMGSTRRMQETVGDLDILVITSNPKIVMDTFTKLPEVNKIISKGPTRATVILQNRMQVDLRAIPEESYGAAVQYFTGSKQHNIITRKIAIKKGFKLSEYGLFSKSSNKRVASSEKEIYQKLGLQWIPPELRTASGEIEAAQNNKLPNLVKLRDIQGDLHMHTTWSDGADSIINMANAAKKLGYSYIAITDHSKTTAIANGLDDKKLKQQYLDIKKARSKVKGIKILWGTECDILSNGKLDYPDDILKKFDLVVAAIHSGFKMPKEKMTERIIKAIKNENVDIMDHPTGRLIDRRPAYRVDLDKVFKITQETKTAFEVNCSPNRLDLNDINIKKAIQKYNLKLTIDSDAHSTSNLNFMNLGVAQARRGWAEKKDILNTLPLSQLKKYFKKIKI